MDGWMDGCVRLWRPFEPRLSVCKHRCSLGPCRARPTAQEPAARRIVNSTAPCYGAIPGWLPLQKGTLESAVCSPHFLRLPHPRCALRPFLAHAFV
eukprot:363785-Chlamydomonas_euryale.AAC.12